MPGKTNFLKGLLTLAFALNFFYCDNKHNHGPDSEETDEGQLTILLKATHELDIVNYPVDSVEIRLSKNRDTLTIGQAYNGPSIALTQLQPESDLHLGVTLFDTQGEALYNCDQSGVSVIGGISQMVPLQCLAEFSLVRVTVPLGIGNPDEITEGSFQLESFNHTYTSALSFQGEVGVFELPQVNGGQTYSIQAQLKQSDGTIVYEQTTDSIFIPKGTSLAVDLTLNSVLGKMNLVLELLSVPTITFTATTSDAQKRPPIAQEIIFTELYPSPSNEDGGSDGEWIEIYNRTRDTLTLEDCRLARARSSGSPTTNYTLDSLAYIKPGQAIVFGRDSVSFRTVPYQFSLVDTKQSLLFLCLQEEGEVVIDSIAYTLEYQAIDSIYAESGKISSLKIESLGQPSLNENWCHTSSPNALNFTSSPGTVLNSCQN